MNLSSTRHSHLHWLRLLAAAKKPEQDEIKRHSRTVSPVEGHTWWLKICTPHTAFRPGFYSFLTSVNHGCLREKGCKQHKGEELPGKLWNSSHEEEAAVLCCWTGDPTALTHFLLLDHQMNSLSQFEAICDFLARSSHLFCVVMSQVSDQFLFVIQSILSHSNGLVGDAKESLLSP